MKKIRDFVLGATGFFVCALGIIFGVRVIVWADTIGDQILRIGLTMMSVAWITILVFLAFACFIYSLSLEE